MPFSDTAFDSHVKSFIQENNYRSYLDVGAGAGKYGKLIKGIHPAATVEAIEIEEKYVAKYALDQVYDKVYNTDVNSFIDNYVDKHYDVCIIGDCIEHLKKSDGINLVEFLIYRTAFIIIVFPTKFVQYSWNGHKHEAHRSVWTKRDFESYDSVFESKGDMNMVLVKGYR
jgi:trans-aconitate methyltransferase